MKKIPYIRGKFLCMKTRLFPLLTMLIIIFLHGCTKNTESTIVLPGEETNVVKFSTIATDELQKALFKDGYNVDTTQKLVLATPPNVEGKYKVSRMFYLAINEVWKIKINDTTYMPYPLSPYIAEINNVGADSLILELKNQNNRTVDMVFSLWSGSNELYHYEMPVSVVGAKYFDNNGKEVEIFAIYYICEKTYIVSTGFDCFYRSGELITGEILPNGIKDFKLCSICRDRYGKDKDLLLDVGNYRVAEDYNNKHQANYITPRID